MKTIKHHLPYFRFFALLILAIALFDFQAWLLEQLSEVSTLPMQAIFTIEGLICGITGILIYRKLKVFNKEMVVDENQLSQREVEVLEYILKGRTNREIEEQLFIEKSTLKSHINRIYKKLDVSDRKDLIRRYSNT